MTDNSILIVGGTGQLGQRLVRRLAAGGVTPRVLVRTSDKARAIASTAEPVIGDLMAPATLREAFAGVERVFIVAPPTPDMETLERNAIDAALAAGARRIVYLSNFAAKEGSDLRPNHIHGLHERIISERSTEWTVLGPTRYMTNFPFNWSSVLRDGVLLEMGGSGVMTCIDPEDVAEIAVRTLTEDGHHAQTYRLTSEDTFTAASLANFLSTQLGRDVRAPDTVPASPGGYFGLVVAGVYRTTDTAARVLGREPRPYADWLRQNLGQILRLA